MDEKRKPPIHEDERVALLKKLLNSNFDKSNVKIVIRYQRPSEKK